MCGIFALLSRSAEPPVEDQCRRALDCLAHRGPDGAGLLMNERVALGHTRLSIVDPEGGAQPLCVADNNLILVCNGEIYNAPELRSWLEGRGHRFRSNSDNEVIPYLYQELGDAFVGHLSGMFAFVLYDAGRQRILAARDRLGIKPLSMAVTDDAVVFASEAKAILGGGFCSAVLEPTHVRQALVLGYGLTDACVFHGIERVPPGTMLCLSVSEPAEIARHQYWNPASLAASVGPFAGEDDLRAALTESVERHLIGDVPFALYLSGGIDSSVVAHLAQKASGIRSLDALTLSFPERDFDEAGEAREFARQTGLHLHEVKDRAWSLTDLRASTLSLESPQIVTLDLSMMALSAQARQLGFKFILGGDGADEVFGGYDHFGMNKLERFVRAHVKDPMMAGAIRDYGRTAFGYPDDADCLAWAQADNTFLARYALPWAPIWLQNAGIVEALMPGATNAVLGSDGDVPRFLDGIGQEVLDASPIRQSIILELAMRLPGWILPRADANSMAHGIEVRVPFLDPEILSVMSRVRDCDLDMLLSPKAFLRRSVRSFVPNETWRRTKRAFNTSNAWLWEDDEVREMMHSDFGGLFEPAPVRALYDQVVRAEQASVKSMRHSLRAQTLVGVITTSLLHQTCWSAITACNSRSHDIRIGVLP